MFISKSIKLIIVLNILTEWTIFGDDISRTRDDELTLYKIRSFIVRSII